MGHPLAPDLSKLSDDELNRKYNEIMKRCHYAYVMGRTDHVQQLQMLSEDYQFEMQNRHRKALEEMEKHSPNFKDIIDIK